MHRQGMFPRGWPQQYNKMKSKLFYVYQNELES